MPSSTFIARPYLSTSSLRPTHKCLSYKHARKAVHDRPINASSVSRFYAYLSENAHALRHRYADLAAYCLEGTLAETPEWAFVAFLTLSGEWRAGQTPISFTPEIKIKDNLVVGVNNPR